MARHAWGGLSLTYRVSQFGLAFQTAAEDSGAGTRHDMFETSVVEVVKDDLGPFVEALQLRSS